ncbi:hypothetical protein [Salana multivorans]
MRRRPSLGDVGETRPEHDDGIERAAGGGGEQRRGGAIVVVDEGRAELLGSH